MKLVREHINEKFEETSDPITDMGIGPEYDIFLDDYLQPFLNEYRSIYNPDFNDPSKRIKSNAGVRKYFNKFKEQIEPFILRKYVNGNMWKVGTGWTNKKIKIISIQGYGSLSMFHPEINAGSAYFYVNALHVDKNTGAGRIGKYGIYLKMEYHVTSK